MHGRHTCHIHTHWPPRSIRRQWGHTDTETHTQTDRQTHTHRQTHITHTHIHRALKKILQDTFQPNISGEKLNWEVETIHGF